MKVVVLGGTRFIGREVVRALLADGHDLTLVHRGLSGTPPAGVAEIRGDRGDPLVLAALRRLHPDAVVDLSAYHPDDCHRALAALPSVARWVHTSTGAVYAPVEARPWVESGPLGPWPMWGSYGRYKLACELVLATGRPSGSVTVALRPPYVLGPGNYADREAFVFNRILDGQPIFVEGTGEAPLHFVSARDLGAMFARAVVTDLPEGFVAVNAATDTACTSNELVELCADLTGRSARVTHVLDRPKASVFDRLDHVFPFPDAPYLLSTRRARELGLVRDLDDLTSMLAASLEHLLDDPARRTWAPGPSERRLRASRTHRVT